jgi:signal recognition particle subunit SRP9
MKERNGHSFIIHYSFVHTACSFFLAFIHPTFSSLLLYSFLMPLFSDFSSFFSASHSLFLSNPSKTRYSMKFRPGDRELTLRVTDDASCLKYRTNSSSDWKQIELFNNLFYRLMTSDDPSKVDLNEIKQEKKQNEKSGNEGKKQSKKKK